MAEYFSLTAHSKWKQSSRVRSYLLKRHDKWLKQQSVLPTAVKAFLQQRVVATPGTSRGRPEIPFEESSIKTKKRRVADLLATRSPEELAFADKLSTSSSGSAERKKDALSVAQALALHLDLDLSERKYNMLRSVVNAVHKDLFPSVYKLRAFRHELLPGDIVVTDITAEEEPLDSSYKFDLAETMPYGDEESELSMSSDSDN
ncbi:hypothetical protein NQ314_007950 [Rhamnusium bicolor]|uniref:Uncharacterized protein n=1 Tax=Rhamnusium bicolor TaxID=1586634 RepID=A0AAV8YG28_9CUCU|nr:hypothetical protein NQ314_007950 [Rhamnusium bicolor]